MSELTPIEPDAEEQWEADSWSIREATREDVPAIAIAVRELLIELGASPTLPAALEAPARALIEDGSLGVVLIAEQRTQIVGVLGVSWQVAIRIPGRYGLIQELWVHPGWRGKTIGGDLLAALFKLARRQQVTRAGGRAAQRRLLPPARHRGLLRQLRLQDDWHAHAEAPVSLGHSKTGPTPSWGQRLPRRGDETMSELLLVEQRRGEHDEDGNGAPYILDRHGNMMRGPRRRAAHVRAALRPDASTRA